MGDEDVLRKAKMLTSKTTNLLRHMTEFYEPENMFNLVEETFVICDEEISLLEKLAQTQLTPKERKEVYRKRGHYIIRNAYCTSLKLARQMSDETQARFLIYKPQPIESIRKMVRGWYDSSA